MAGLDARQCSKVLATPKLGCFYQSAAFSCCPPVLLRLLSLLLRPPPLLLLLQYGTIDFPAVTAELQVQRGEDGSFLSIQGLK